MLGRFCLPVFCFLSTCLLLRTFPCLPACRCFSWLRVAVCRNFAVSIVSLYRTLAAALTAWVHFASFGLLNDNDDVSSVFHVASVHSAFPSRCNRLDYTPGRIILGYITALANSYPLRP